MRRISIDFLSPERSRATWHRWLPVGLWISVLAFAAWEMKTGLELMAEIDHLSTPKSRSERAPDAPLGQPSAEAVKIEILSVPELLAGTERAIGAVRRQKPGLRLEILEFDASRRILVVRGKLPHPDPLTPLMAELRSAFPDARAGFPDIRDNAGQVDFEIRLHFPPTETRQ